MFVIAVASAAVTPAKARAGQANQSYAFGYTAIYCECRRLAFGCAVAPGNRGSKIPRKARVDFTVLGASNKYVLLRAGGQSRS